MKLPLAATPHTLLVALASLVALGGCGDDPPADPPLVIETCDDGVQNQGEAGIDCGGPCAPCGAAPTCTDGRQNGDETGVDCGGPCPACQVPSGCGDGVAQGDEQCDEPARTRCDYGEQSCMVCNEQCQLVPGLTRLCGDSIVQANDGEQCDGVIGLTGRVCQEQGFAVGRVSCNMSCQFDYSGCFNVVQVGAGQLHSCALLDNGRVMCWGLNVQGQLGDGTTTSRRRPALVVDLDDAVELSVGAYYSCARRRSGQVVCWGENNKGQLGDGSETDRDKPTPVVGISSARQISAGRSHACALLSDKTVSCWGENRDGELGDGTQLNRALASPVMNLSQVAQVSAGSSHTCAVGEDGSVRCWGSGIGGKLGVVDANGFAPFIVTTPRRVTELSEVSQISAGFLHTCAVTRLGAVRCWGLNSEGQLGDGTNISSDTPISVRFIGATVHKIVASFGHTCAIMRDGSARCWGGNTYGQLGDGSTTSRAEPSAVGGMNTMVHLATTGDHTCAALVDGGARCWGHNITGAIGDNTTIDQPSPTPIAW
jgi:alpha-tubulin suppressor-like RCC1 family protein